MSPDGFWAALSFGIGLDVDLDVHALYREGLAVLRGLEDAAVFDKKFLRTMEAISGGTSGPMITASMPGFSFATSPRVHSQYCDSSRWARWFSWTAAPSMRPVEREVRLSSARASRARAS